MGKTSSKDNCESSESAHHEIVGKHGEDMKTAIFLGNPETSINHSSAEINQPMVQFPYACTDPYFTGLFSGYGPHNVVQPQMIVATSGRVPLPVDLPEDGPIYVNAKQYHGILRRRQTRAKLEAQNKLVKTRKPYLHESRHKHALNRVRGTGGRFLSTKKQESESSDPIHFNHKTNTQTSNVHTLEPPNDGSRISVTSQQMTTEGGFSSIPVNGGLMYNGNRHYASTVR